MSKGCIIDWKSTNSIAISGEVDEYADFAALDRYAGQILYVDFAKVTRLNSSGLRTWLQTILKNRIQLILRECSVVVVEQFAMIPQFIGKNGTVESFFARYHCVSCFYECQQRFQVGQNLDPEAPHMDMELKEPCPECGDTVELELAPEIYLSFLRVQTPAAS